MAAFQMVYDAQVNVLFAVHQSFVTANCEIKKLIKT